MAERLAPEAPAGQQGRQDKVVERWAPTQPTPT
jgi:hypothetical protein